jgi:hypothetical protein
MKKHKLVRAIQYLEKHYGSVDIYAEHDMVYLCISVKEIPLHRLKMLQCLQLFTEECLDAAEADGLSNIEVSQFIFYT